MLLDLIKQNRSYRRFDESHSISSTKLREIVACVRYLPSGKNAQSLKYFLSSEKETNDVIFPHLAWAGYLKEWNGPESGERPSAYVVILNDKSISTNYYCDHGISAQSILLAAVEQGLGGCIIAAVQKEKLHKALSLPDELEILLVLALGKPNENIVIEDLEAGGDSKYWRDKNGGHHVPKRSFEELIIQH